MDQNYEIIAEELVKIAEKCGVYGSDDYEVDADYAMCLVEISSKATNKLENGHPEILKGTNYTYICLTRNAILIENDHWPAQEDYKIYWQVKLADKDCFKKLEKILVKYSKHWINAF